MSESLFPEIDHAIERVPDKDRPFGRELYQDLLAFLKRKGALAAIPTVRGAADVQLLRTYAEDARELRGTTWIVTFVVLLGLVVSALVIAGVDIAGGDTLSVGRLLRPLAPLLATGFVVILFTGLRMSMLAMDFHQRVRRALSQAQLDRALLVVAAENRDLGERLYREFVPQ